MNGPVCNCRFQWGERGASAAAARGDITVVVDVLSFTTSVAVAVDRGAHIFPCRMEDDPAAIADEIGAVAAVRRRDVSDKGQFSLSPLTYEKIRPGQRVVVASPNGATCSACATRTEYVLAGALVNASAVAGAVTELMSRTAKAVSVIACGELEDFPGRREIRWALEDYLGAGAIISCLSCSKSPDAIVCESAFLQNRDRLPDLIRGCRSGQELIEQGFGTDVDLASQLDSHLCVPVLSRGRFARYGSDVRV